MREAWTNFVAPEDYEAHMSAIGQAQANAAILRDSIESAHLPEGARILIAGAGTGQCFDFVPAEFLAPFEVTFSDISARLLERLRLRLASSPWTAWRTVVDDLEDTRLPAHFDFAAAVLVLEHIDLRRGLDSLASLAPRLLIVIQRNPEGAPSAVSAHRTVPGSMSLMREFPPKLADPQGIEAHLGNLGFRLAASRNYAVADGKSMLSLLFVSSRFVTFVKAAARV